MVKSLMMLTYGEIISIVTAEGIKLCNDFKLKQQMKNEQKSTRTNLDHSVASLVLAKRKLCLPLNKNQAGSLAKISFTTAREVPMTTIG